MAESWRDREIPKDPGTIMQMADHRGVVFPEQLVTDSVVVELDRARVEIQRHLSGLEAVVAMLGVDLQAEPNGAGHRNLGVWLGEG